MVKVKEQEIPGTIATPTILIEPPQVELTRIEEVVNVVSNIYSREARKNKKKENK